ncbi:MAG TPA: zf-HC2 domain-containing protein [Pyrinomonadaceae bacterium]|jgi:hypothetical protein
MFDANHKNSGCGFADDLVSYLYGEDAALGNAAFEAHLETCAACAGELEALAGVRFLLSDWKAREFAALETPSVEITYPVGAPKNPVSTPHEPRAFGFRKFWPFRPAWSLAVACAAILSIAAGVVFLSIGFAPKTDLAVGGNRHQTEPSMPSAANSPEPVKVIESPADRRENRAAVPAKTRENAAAGNVNRAGKKSVKERQMPKTKESASPQTADPARKIKNKSAPPVLTEDEEDETLRLAELFEEIETKE